MKNASPTDQYKIVKKYAVPKFLVVVCGIFGILFAIAAVGLLVRLFIWETMDVIGLIIFAVCIVISSICLTVVCGQTPDFFNKELKERAVHLRDVWKISHIAWLITYYMFNGFAMLFLILTIYIGAVYPDHQETISKMLGFSVLSLFFDYLNLFINPKKIAKGYRLAYEKIDESLESEPQMSERCKYISIKRCKYKSIKRCIVKSIKSGEEIIGRNTFE